MEVQSTFDSGGGAAAALQPTDADKAALLQLIMGFRVTQMLHAAADLRVADHLRAAAQRPDTLAAAVGAHPTALARLLRALASLGVFRENPDGTFALTPRAALLCHDAPDSMHPLAVLYGADWLWDAWTHLPHAVRTGTPAFGRAHGTSLYAFLRAKPHAAATFDAAMTGYSALEERAIRAACDFGRYEHLVDVGAGRGALVAALLLAHPRLRATVFDQPGTIDAARAVLDEAGVADRCAVVAGDFFAEIPQAPDAVLLKSILHNWNDADAGRILGNCFRAMRRGARLLVAERVLPPGNGASEAKLFDVNMLVMLGGRERTEAQYRALLGDAGFELVQVRGTGCALSVLEAVRA